MITSLRGYRTEDRRALSLREPILTLPASGTLVVPLPGAEEGTARLVRPGDKLAAGQRLSLPRRSAPAHAPAAGVAEEIEFREMAVCGPVWTVRLRTGGERRASPLRPLPDRPEDEDVLRAAADAGIFDEMTGRPLFQELYRLRRLGAGLLLACAVEDDPWCSSACAVLREDPEKVERGLRLAAVACGGAQIGAAVSTRREEAALRRARPGLRVEAAGRRYPARAFLLRRLRAAGVSAGLIGPQALCALADAADGLPQTSGVITVSGDGVKAPRNVRAANGTPARALLEACGVSEDVSLVYAGPAWRGSALTDPDAPLPLHARCLTAMLHAERRRQSACIGCGRCGRVCPQGILPWQIHESLRGEKVEPYLLLNVQSCIGCAACTAVCPSGLPLSAEVSRAAAIRKSGDFL